MPTICLENFGTLLHWCTWKTGLLENQIIDLIHWLLISTQIWGFYFMGENWFPIDLCIIFPFELYSEITTDKCKFVEIIEVWIYHTFQKMVYIIYSTTIGVLCFEDQAWSKNWNTSWMFVHLGFWNMESGRLLF
jgi:hypothetical protein